MTPLERLLAEDIPTRPAPAPPSGPARRWTPEEQAQHLADLLEAVSDWHWEDDTRVGKRRRHLQLIRTAQAA